MGLKFYRLYAKQSGPALQFESIKVSIILTLMNLAKDQSAHMAGVSQDPTTATKCKMSGELRFPTIFYRRTDDINLRQTVNGWLPVTTESLFWLFGKSGSVNHINIFSDKTVISQFWSNWSDKPDTRAVLVNMCNGCSNVRVDFSGPDDSPDCRKNMFCLKYLSPERNRNLARNFEH
ncbi:hypothetical protein CSKR_102611 [Clonorchis sinensis]|nr:hypothetical protein CSKR_102611 [Clonorchis sinensis]